MRGRPGDAAAMFDLGDRMKPGGADAAPAIPDAKTGDDTAVATPVPLEGPRRLVIATFGLGILDQTFQPAFAGPAPDPHAAWERNLLARDIIWSPILAPLADLREELTVVDGLAMQTVMSTAGAGFNLATVVTTLSGWISPGQGKIRGPTIDWLIGEANPSPAAHLIVASGGSPMASVDDQDQPIFSPVGRTFEVHQRVLALHGGGCKDTSAAPTTFPRGVAGWMDQMIPIVRDALRCDVTRVFSLHLGWPQSQELGFDVGIDVHQDLADAVLSEGAGGARARDGMTRFAAFNVAQVGNLARALRDVKQGPNSTLLDHTLIVLVSTEAHPAHQPYPWKMIMLGGRALGLRTGRYLHVAQQFKAKILRSQGDGLIGGPHNWALVSIARIMGVGLSSVGDTELTLLDGPRVDLTGPIPGL